MSDPKYVALPPHVAALVDDYAQIMPSQGGMGIHPVGTFDAVVTDTEIKVTKDNSGWYVAVTFDTPAGQAVKRYNRGNSNEIAVNIAKGELSALAHALGNFNGQARDHYAAWRGSRCKIVVVPQMRGTEEDRAKGYTEVSKVLDTMGNEPGKPPVATNQVAPAPAANGQQAPAGAWGGAPAPAAATTAPAPANAGWGAPPAGAGQQNPAPAGWAAPR